MSAAVTLALPGRGRGRLNAVALAAHEAEIEAFCAFILDIRSSLDFTPQLRGWCYILENAGRITKADFDRAEQFITDRRKDGGLPLDVTAVDEARTFNDEPYPWINRGATPTILPTVRRPKSPRSSTPMICSESLGAHTRGTRRSGSGRGSRSSS